MSMGRIADDLCMAIAPAVVVSLALGLASGRPPVPSLHLVPRPREVTILRGVVRVDSRWTVTGAAEDSVAIALLRADLPVSVTSTPAPAGRMVLQAIPPRGPILFDEQGYTLAISPQRITIGAVTAVGRFYGVQTMRQLLRGSASGTLRSLRIQDYPCLRWRGVSDDISRGQVSMLTDFVRIIHELAYEKANLYQPY